ncbi:MAG: MBOAT family protein [Sphingobacteriales bacterium]|nr:MBOAT family protein [Sphingobacteriales bacterium]
MMNQIWQSLAYDGNNPMIFNSGQFLLFFLVFMLGYSLVYNYQLPKVVFITAFSLYFYYKSSGVYVGLLFVSTVVDFYLARAIHAAQHKVVRKFWLVVSLVANLGLLGYFKYTNFFGEIWSNLSGGNFMPLDIFLPVGISFFTFQSLSYTIDVYRGELKPINSLLNYGFYISFFPQLVAGPIVRARDFIPQITQVPHVTQAMMGRAVFLIAAGLFKKAVISDYIGVNFVDRVFSTPLQYTGLENLFAIYGYALQIYCDFSGYSDMAIGIALLLGFHFPANFNAPYQARNIVDFWRRWHISLSTWLRDYLYIALGGNRKGKVRTYINLLITMLLGGLWHGASFKFIIWGGLHGLALAAHKFYHHNKRAIWGKAIASNHTKANTNSAIKYLNHFLGMVVTFNFVCFCWIFFRAPDLETARQIIEQILWQFHPEVFVEFLSGYTHILLFMVLGYFIHFIPQPIEQYYQDNVTRWPLIAQALLLVAVIWLVVQVKSADIQPFIYYQF